MNKFGGFLICSDIDGTFRCGGDTEKINSEAVKYFTENGGRFTFATGRMFGNLQETQISEVANAPVCLCNGGIIFDHIANRIIYECHTDFTIHEFYNEIKTFDDIKVYIYSNNDVSYTVNLQDIPSLGDEILNSKPLKTVCVFKTPEEADKFKNTVLSLPFFKNTYITKSWPVGVEFNSINATKGTAITKIKNLLGDIHTSIGVGDYENDLSLIRDADIGVAVGNAIECVKNEADIIIKPASEYAIADLINYIETKLL